MGGYFGCGFPELTNFEIPAKKIPQRLAKGNEKWNSLHVASAIDRPTSWVTFAHFIVGFSSNINVSMGSARAILNAEPQWSKFYNIKPKCFSMKILSRFTSIIDPNKILRIDCRAGGPGGARGPTGPPPDFLKSNKVVAWLVLKLLKVY